MGEDSLKYLKEILMYRRCFFIIDKIVYEKFYSTYLKELISDLNHDIYLFECVERNKDINIVIEIIRILSQNGYIRDSVLIRRYCWICFINIYEGDKIYKYTNHSSCSS